MVTIRDSILLPVNDDSIVQAVEYSLATHFKDNLRHRDNAVRLDSMIRGKIGELALRHWLEHNDIIIIDNNTTSDVFTPDTDLRIQSSTVLSCEIKTSLIPDSWYSLEKTLQKADIKIIKREKSIMDISNNIHVQLFFNFYRDKRDRWLRSLNISHNNITANEIIDTLNIPLYKNQTFFVAWIDTLTLSEQLQSMAQPIWTYGKREFWKCNIQTQSKCPRNLIHYIKEYS